MYTVWNVNETEGPKHLRQTIYCLFKYGVYDTWRAKVIAQVNKSYLHVSRTENNVEYITPFAVCIEQRVRHDVAREGGWQASLWRLRERNRCVAVIQFNIPWDTPAGDPCLTQIMPSYSLIQQVFFFPLHKFHPVLEWLGQWRWLVFITAAMRSIHVWTACVNKSSDCFAQWIRALARVPFTWGTVRPLEGQYNYEAAGAECIIFKFQ